MSVARSSLRSFLAQAKSNLRAAILNGQKVTFVVGNESADLDSLTSSLLLAYIRSNSLPADAFSRSYIPLTNIPRSDLNLRPEFQAVLRYANVCPEELITLDELPASNELAANLKPELTHWVLVDHNSLQGGIGSIYSGRVMGGIDHHDDEHKIPDDTGKEPRIITKTGSCTSLVTNYCRDYWNQIARAKWSGVAETEMDNHYISGQAESTLWDAQLAQVALASILIDTANLKDKTKVTKHDIDAVQYLEAKIMASIECSKDFDRDRFYHEISDAKHDIGGLKLYDILRKDYKQWTEGLQTLGVSSVVKDMDFLIDKASKEQIDKTKTEAYAHAINSFAEEKGLDMFSIMTTSTSSSGDFQRELLLFARNAESVQAAIKFEMRSKAELGLAKWHGSVDDFEHTGDDEWRKIWRQQNVQHSRKRVAPLLREAMND